MAGTDPERLHLSPPSLSAPFGRYHQLVRVEGARRMLFLSGLLAIGRDGSVPEGVEAQAEAIFADIQHCLDSAGMARGSIVRLQTFLTDARHRQAYMPVRDRWVADPPPASTLIIVKALANPACLIEIEATAAD